MLVRCRITLQFYTWVERGTVRVKRFAQEQNEMYLARMQTQTAQSGDEHTDDNNHEVLARWRTRMGACIHSCLLIKITVTIKNTHTTN